jgi:hypothetical protein
MVSAPAEVDDPGLVPAVDHRHQDIRGLEVAVDDAVQVRVLHRAAHFGEEPATGIDVQALPVAKRGDGHARHQLHRKPWQAVVCGARVEDPRDTGMVHRGQRLPLRLETQPCVLAAQAATHELDRHLTAQRRHLLGAVDQTHPASAQHAEDAVGPDALGHRVPRVA